MKRNFSSRQRKILALAAGNICLNCGVALPSTFHADHIRPFSKGGETVIHNGQALCAPCNQKKGAKFDKNET